MYLTERHIVTRNHREWKKIDELCFLSKNLYNSALFEIKQNFLKEGKWIRYGKMDKIMKSTNENYNLLPNNSSQQILMVLDKNLKSYFALLKKYKKDKKSLNGCPKFPKYKHKTKGRNIIIFTPNQFKYKNGFIHFPKKTQLKPIKTNNNSIKSIRIIPEPNNYTIEIIYFKQEKEYKKSNNYLSIDIGLNNLMTCFDTKNNKALIINGRPLKSINQYYNKKKAKIQNELKIKNDKNTSNKLNRLTLKRNNKIKNYIHTSSRIIVDYCVNNDISDIIIGYNKQWKDEINLGKKINQSFVQIPFYNLINQLEYKCKLEGIKVTVREESYTSKCSSLDIEEIKKHEEYMGRRVKRGLFESNKGIKINADLNGALNILRKETGDKVYINKYTLTSRGQVDWPIKLNSKFN